MLPPFIIDQIRKRELERDDSVQPQLELPMPPMFPFRREPEPTTADEGRGVVIIDLLNP